VLRHDAKVDLIRHVPLFSRLSRSDLREVASLVDEVDMPEGKMLTREGDAGHEFFVLVDGTAAVNRDGREIATMKPGDFFGELALVSDRPRTATVTTTSPARLLVLDERAFRGLMLDNSDFHSKILGAVCDRLPADSD
jgi:CRP-like cAMP-binding protein